MKKFKTIFFLLIGSISLFAQDATFDQFQNAPLQNNPALVGEHAEGRLILNYQIGAASLLQLNNLHLPSISYDRAIQLKNGDQIGVGIRTEGYFAKEFYHERVLFGGVSLAYRKHFAEGKHILSAGIEGGPGQRTIFLPALNWGTGTTSQEERITVNLFDFNAGLSYTGHFDKIKEFQLGAAYYHLNRADVSIDGTDEDRLYRRFTAHASLLFAPTKSSLLRPQVYARLQGPSTIFGIGAIATQKFEGRYSDFSLNLGGYLNTNNRFESGNHLDNLALIIGPEFKNFGLNYSRNINLSDLRHAGRYYSRNEFSFIWKL